MVLKTLSLVLAIWLEISKSLLVDMDLILS